MKIWFNGKLLKRMDELKTQYQTMTEFVAQLVRERVIQLERERDGKKKDKY